LSQKLILPINKAVVTAGYRNAKYVAQFGFTHYGIDLVSATNDRTVWGSGNGTVLATGTDKVLGKVVIVKYLDIKLKNGTVIPGIIQRIFHLDSISVTAGQKITKDTRLGYYGDTGLYSTGAHLHIEFDTDLVYYAYSPTLSGNSNIIMAGTNTTLNPAQVMFVKSTSPDYQKISGASGSDCWSASDIAYAYY